LLPLEFERRKQYFFQTSLKAIMTYFHYEGAVRSRMSHYGEARVKAGENGWILFLYSSAILRNTQNKQTLP